jgi:hypothetical protein
MRSQSFVGDHGPQPQSGALARGGVGSSNVSAKQLF